MTHRRNCSLSRPCTPSAPPCCSWAACVCCVCECLQPVCKSLYVWANWIIFSGSGGEQEEDRTFFFFFSQDIWEWWTRRTEPSVLSDCFWSFLESEGVWTWTGRKCHLSDKSHAWTDVWSSVFIAGGQDPLDLHQTICCLSLEKQSWLLSLFVLLWAWPHRVFDWELQTCYCSQTNEGLE